MTCPTTLTLISQLMLIRTSLPGSPKWKTEIYFPVETITQFVFGPWEKTPSKTNTQLKTFSLEVQKLKIRMPLKLMSLKLSQFRIIELLPFPVGTP